MVNGPLGELTQDVPARMQIEQTEGVITVTRPTERGDDRALHGLTRTLIANMVEGVTKGFEKRLELQGVGYRAALQGTDLRLDVGYSHPVVIKAPQGITFEVPDADQIVVKGVAKQQVGQIAAEIRKVRPPEPYKGKGIRYQGEYVRRKVGKRALTSAAPDRRDAGVRASAAGHRRVARRKARRRARPRRPRGSLVQSRARTAASRAARRRRQRPHDRVGQLAAGCEVVQRQQVRAGGGGRQAAGPERKDGRRSTASCSTAAATSTTDASRRWPMPRAKGD